MYDNSSCFVCIDLELSSLDLEKGQILEIACLVIDKDFNVVSDDFNVVIHYPDSILNYTSEWAANHLSNLIDECRCSKIGLKDAEQMLLDFLKKYIPESTCPLAGNTVYKNRLFLYKYMPLVNNYLHYKIIDVSSIKELVRRWRPLIYDAQPKKKLAHSALSDVKESIQQLKYYKENIFISPML